MENIKPPLWKQVAGALVGATLSLVMYQGWKTTSPHVTAWLSVPETTSEVAVELSDYNGATTEQFERIARRAREISVKFENVHGAPPEQIEANDPVIEAIDEPESLPLDENATDEVMPMHEDDLYPDGEPHDESAMDAPVQDLPNHPPRAPVRYPPAEQMVQPEMKVPSLPSSGVGVMAGSFAMLGAATGWLRSRKKGRV